MAVDVTKKVKHGTATASSAVLVLPESEPTQPGGEYAWMLVENLTTDQTLYVREDGATAVAAAAGNIGIGPGGAKVFALTSAAVKCIASGSCPYQTIGLTDREAGLL